MKKSIIKKISAAILASVMAVSLLAGCGSSSASSGSGDDTYLFVGTDTDDTFRAALTSAIEDAASAAGINLDEQQVGADTYAQIAAIQKAASSGYKGIICRANDVDTALQLELAAGDLPIVYVNNEPSEDRLKQDQYIYVGSPEEDAGKYEAEYVWSALGKPSEVNLVIIKGEKGHSATEARTNAARNYFKDNGVTCNVVFCDFANWSTDEAYSLMDTFSKTQQPFDAVICNNDSMAIGVVNWLQDNGYDTSKIPVTGVDATADGCASIQAGGMQFTVLQDAKGQAQKAVESVIALGNGGSISKIDGASDDGKYVWVPFTKVDSSNVSDYAQ